MYSAGKSLKVTVDNTNSPYLMNQAQNTSIQIPVMIRSVRAIPSSTNNIIVVLCRVPVDESPLSPSSPATQ